MVLFPCSTSGSDSSVSDGIPDGFHSPDPPVSPQVPPILRWEGCRARVEQGDRGCRCPSATLPPGTDGATQEEAAAETGSEECPAPDKPEPHQHPGEPGATTVRLAPEGTVLQGHLSPVLSHPSSGSDPSPVPPRPGPAGIQFFLVSREEVAVWERSPEPAPVSPFPGHLKQGMAAVPPWEGVSWTVAQMLGHTASHH